MFEKYQFQSVHIAIQAVLTLYAQGKKRNVLEMGKMCEFDILEFPGINENWQKNANNLHVLVNQPNKAKPTLALK